MMTLPDENLAEGIRRVTSEAVELVPYDAAWPERFAAESSHLRECLPRDLIGRIEHFGSTAVPGLAAKPIVDILIEVASLDRTKAEVAPILEAQGYDYFWRPTHGDDGPPFYAWFIKRDSQGVRTHHIHMVERDFEHWNTLLFRDYLIAHPDVARAYESIKRRLSREFPRDRIAYTRGKSEFIERVTAEAMSYYGVSR